MNILLTTDGSEGSLDAVRFFSGFTCPAETHLHILTIQPESENEALCAEKAATIHATTRQALGDFAGQVTTSCTQTRLSTGRIVERIQVAAEMMPADLVVTGSRGHSRVAHFFLGSVALGVARHSPCSVLIGRMPQGELKRVVIGVDDSDDSLSVIDFVNRLPLPPGCVMHLVNVAVPDEVAERSGTRLPAYLRRTIADAINKGQKEGRERLAEASAELRAFGRTATTELRYGDPVTELLAAAGENTDLVVVGARRHSSLGEYFLGSVSSSVVEIAKCSVLVVRG